MNKPTNKQIPYCPLMSAGNDLPVVCAQERCAWYVKQSCSVYLLAYDAAMNIKEKQAKKGV